MNKKLFEHQITGADYLAARKRAYLGDPPGFGKTRTAIVAAHESNLYPLVVCPAIVRTHWRRELALYYDYDVPVFSYDEIVRGGFAKMADLLTMKAYQPNLLILDEAHYLKHPTSQRTRLLLGKDGYARRMTRVWALSGTPTPKNNPAEYWTILAALFPEVALQCDVKTPAQWMARTCLTYDRMVRGRMTTKVVGIKDQELVRLVFQNTMLRRSVADLEFTMPPVVEQLVLLDLNESVVQPNFGWGPDTPDFAASLADPELARYRRKVGEAKVTPALEMLKSQLAGSDEKLVVFAHHRSVLTALYEGLRDFGVAYIDGDVGQPARAEQIDLFQNDPRVRVFLGQTIACHTGITLTAAHRVVLVEPDWTREVNVQAGARVARIGQEKGVCIVQYIAAANTLDEGIIRSLAREEGMGEMLYGKA